MTTVDLRTTYVGLELAGPLIASSSPLTGDVETARHLEAAGAAAIVLPSLFQEQIEHEEIALTRLHEHGAESFLEATSYLPDFESYNTGPDGYLELVTRMREALQVPVIASLNGISVEGWAKYARLVELAGAHAVELNVLHVPTDPEMSAADVEGRIVAEVAAVRAAVGVPVAVKIGPHFTAPAHLAAALQAAGADGLVLFNRPLDPDIDLETLDVVPHLELSTPAEMHTALRWIAILAARTPLSLAATGGVHDAHAALKLLLAGAHVVQVASALLQRGPGFLRSTLATLTAWLEENDYLSVAQLRGSLDHARCPDPTGYERLNYMKALLSWSPSNDG